MGFGFVLVEDVYGIECGLVFGADVPFVGAGNGNELSILNRTAVAVGWVDV